MADGVQHIGAYLADFQLVPNQAFQFTGAFFFSGAGIPARLQHPVEFFDRHDPLGQLGIDMGVLFAHIHKQLGLAHQIALFSFLEDQRHASRCKAARRVLGNLAVKEIDPGGIGLQSLDIRGLRHFVNPAEKACDFG